MTDPQQHADRVRELVSDADVLRRLGIEVLRAVGAAEGLTIRARHGYQTLTARRGPGWLAEPPGTLAEVLTRDLVADVLAPPPPSIAAAAPRWGRAMNRGHRRPGPPAS